MYSQRDQAQGWQHFITYLSKYIIEQVFSIHWYHRLYTEHRKVKSTETSKTDRELTDTLLARFGILGPSNVYMNIYCQIIIITLNTGNKNIAAGFPRIVFLLLLLKIIRSKISFTLN